MKQRVHVIVATARALKVHGGVSPYKLKVPNEKAVRKGLCNLARQVENARHFDIPVLVAVNRFEHDTKAEIESQLQDKLVPMLRKMLVDGKE